MAREPALPLRRAQRSCATTDLLPAAIPLPRRLRSLFWDYDFAQLRWTSDHNLIIGRILSAGDWEAVQWLRRVLGPFALRDWLERKHGAGLSPRQLRFWELVLDIPRRTVNRWLADPRRQSWEGRRHA